MDGRVMRGRGPRQSPLRTLTFLSILMVGAIALYTRDGGHHGTTHAAAVPYHHPSQTCVTVDYDYTRDKNILQHAWDAWAKGQPVRLHIAREKADAHRSASLRGIPTKPGYDRDEYPPAMSREGGQGADVRYVRSAENRRTGNEMREQLQGYPDGQCFEYEKPPLTGSK